MSVESFSMGLLMIGLSLFSGLYKGVAVAGNQISGQAGEVLIYRFNERDYENRTWYFY